MLETGMYNGSSNGNVAISSNFLLHSSMLGPSDCSKVLRKTSNFSSRSLSLFIFWYFLFGKDISFDDKGLAGDSGSIYVYIRILYSRLST